MFYSLQYNLYYFKHISVLITSLSLYLQMISFFLFFLLFIYFTAYLLNFQAINLLDKLYDTFFTAPRKTHVRLFSKHFIKIEFLDKYGSQYWIVQYMRCSSLATAHAHSLSCYVSDCAGRCTRSLMNGLKYH